MKRIGMKPYDSYLRVQCLLLAVVLQAVGRFTSSPGRRRDDRGDVPGWVLVTVMTVTIVTAIWGIAKPQLVGMLRNALNSVK